jgi:drug/metabolite transporter superfamily protein YnfA
MTTAVVTLASLIVAATLESGGDAAIRLGLLHDTKSLLVLGALLLVAYGFVVNVNRLVDFGTLMGGYIAVFFAVSQVLSMALGGRPAPTTLVGGAFIVVGGLIVQYGARAAN